MGPREILGVYVQSRMHPLKEAIHVLGIFSFFMAMGPF